VLTDRASLAAMLETSSLSPAKLLLASSAPPSEDAIYLFAFALIMLNTDLHRATSKKVSKMSQKKNLA
jgi:Sec7-like guanine-nucleotide exchange factor